MLIRTGIVVAALTAGVAGFGLFSPNVESREAAPSLASKAFKVDTVHSSVIFRIKHKSTAWFYGRFDDLSGTIAYDPADPSASTMSFEVKIDSVHSGNSRRDNHLKSPDFFNSRQFPVSTFVSTSFASAGDNVYEVSGDLTINGTTRPVTIELRKTGGITEGSKELIGFETIFDIKRSDFGITWGPDALGDDVRMTVSIEAIRG